MNSCMCCMSCMFSCIACIQSCINSCMFSGIIYEYNINSCMNFRKSCIIFPIIMHYSVHVTGNHVSKHEFVENITQILHGYCMNTAWNTAWYFLQFMHELYQWYNSCINKMLPIKIMHHWSCSNSCITGFMHEFMP